MAATPRKGPRQRLAKANGQPTASTSGGIKWMVRMVNRKPAQVCMVNMVPT
jgi:hypothetical protein